MKFVFIRQGAEKEVDISGIEKIASVGAVQCPKCWVSYDVYATKQDAFGEEAIPRGATAWGEVLAMFKRMDSHHSDVHPATIEWNENSLWG
jgi:hypothetical protein